MLRLPRAPKTERSSSRKRRQRTPKLSQSRPPSTRRSAPGRVETRFPPDPPPPPPFIQPATPPDVFLPFTIDLEHSPAPDPTNDSVPSDEPVSSNDPVTVIYQHALARLRYYVTNSILTNDQSRLLDATMKTAQFFVFAGEAHPLLSTIASPDTPPSEVLALVSTITHGMRAFMAHPGPSAHSRDTASTSSSSSSTASRTNTVKAACASRDNSTCVISGVDLGGCCHIIPFSARREKADQFWALVGMFKGVELTRRIRIMTLGQHESTDCIANVLWLSPNSHVYFDNGSLALVPDVPAGEYDPGVVSEYTARVEFLYGADSIILGVLSTVNGQRHRSFLAPGDNITLRTPDPRTLPLPHPLLLQLHTAFTRLRKMCASAGIPILPTHSDTQSDPADALDRMSESSHESDDSPAPQFIDNGIWSVVPRPGGLPLKERFVRLLAETEREQYVRVMEDWAGGKVALVGAARKRPWEVVVGSEPSGSSDSRSRYGGGKERRWWSCVGSA